MGREIKRVALDFVWPHNKVWEGFVNFHSDKSCKCLDCDGSGSSPESRRLADMWYGKAPFKPEDNGCEPLTPETPEVKERAQRNLDSNPQYYGTGPAALRREGQRLCDLWNAQWGHHLRQCDVDALVEAGRLMDFTHQWSAEAGWVKREPAVCPTAQEVNRWSLLGMGHDGINQWSCVSAECERLGVSGMCDKCVGDGCLWPSEQDRLDFEGWTRTEPPEGEGYQLWETVSEGSPVSPVFDTPEDLARWLVRNPHGIDKGTSYETWLAFIRGPGWAPSMALESGIVKSGVSSRRILS